MARIGVLSDDNRRGSSHDNNVRFHFFEKSNKLTKKISENGETFLYGGSGEKGLLLTNFPLCWMATMGGDRPKVPKRVKLSPMKTTFILL